jgi:hypothetical protein
MRFDVALRGGPLVTRFEELGKAAGRPSYDIAGTRR